jgi:hypothetical protein
MSNLHKPFKEYYEKTHQGMPLAIFHPPQMYEASEQLLDLDEMIPQDTLEIKAGQVAQAGAYDFVR